MGFRLGFEKKIIETNIYTTSIWERSKIIDENSFKKCEISLTVYSGMKRREINVNLWCCCGIHCLHQNIIMREKLWKWQTSFLYPSVNSTYVIINLCLASKSQVLRFCIPEFSPYVFVFTSFSSRTRNNDLCNQTIKINYSILFAFVSKSNTSHHSFISRIWNNWKIRELRAYNVHT